MSFVGIGAVVMSQVGKDGATPSGCDRGPLVVCAIVGARGGRSTLRLTGIYLALGTAAFSVLMSKVVFSQTKLVAYGTVKVPGLDLGVFEPTTNQQQALLLAVVFGCCSAPSSSGCGVAPTAAWLIAMKDSPVACATLGLDLTRTKIGVFALSASIAGLAGALANRSMPTSDYELLSSMSVTMLAVVGGIERSAVRSSAGS